MPFFSIVLPTYNRAHMLSKAVESVISQTFTDWELILVDDGSSDNTKELVDSFADSRIRYLYQTNQERSVARNNGINHAEGEYICFLDSDDYFLEDKLNKIYGQISVSSEKVVWYDGLITEKNGHCHQMPFPTSKNNVNILEFVVTNNLFSQQICGHNLVFKKFKFNPSLRIGEDMELWFRIANEYSFKPILNSFQTVIVEHEGRSINLKKSNVALEQLKTLNYIFSGPSGIMIKRKVKKYILSNCHFNVGKHYMHNNKKLNAISWIIKSIFYDIHNDQLKHRIYCIILLMSFKIPKEYLTL